ncbi:MAG: DUF4835 family protein [Cytophagales bacterium]|nr:DUF4835 family protein [Cytophagales bacterium]
MLRYHLLILLIVPLIVSAQELNCRVVVNADQVQTTERSIFQEMEVVFAEFMNNRRWTEDQYEQEERINCNLILTISQQPSIGRFEASVQVLSSRPVFNTDYESVLMNFADRDWTFEYVASQPIQFSENTFLDNISSLLAYYAYMIIGFDYDSFSELGGEDYFQKAWQVVINAQQSGYPGWEQFNSIRNRYWLAENLLSNEMEPIRRAQYQYHRQGMDNLSEAPDDAHKSILESLGQIQKANNARPRSILTISFLDAKADELAQIFSTGNPSERREAYNILTNIDPTKSEVFEAMIK